MLPSKKQQNLSAEEPAGDPREGYHGNHLAVFPFLPTPSGKVKWVHCF